MALKFLNFSRVVHVAGVMSFKKGGGTTPCVPFGDSEHNFKELLAPQHTHTCARVNTHAHTHAHTYTHTHTHTHTVQNNLKIPQLVGLKMYVPGLHVACLVPLLLPVESKSNNCNHA